MRKVTIRDIAEVDTCMYYLIVMLHNNVVVLLRPAYNLISVPRNGPKAIIIMHCCYIGPLTSEMDEKFDYSLPIYEL